jgi:MFS family permease
MQVFNPILAGVLLALALCASAIGTFVTRDLKLDPRDDRNGDFVFALRLLTPMGGVLCLGLASNAYFDTTAKTSDTTLIIAMVLAGLFTAAAGMTSIALFINFDRPLLGMLYAVMAFAFFGTLCYPAANFALLHGHAQGTEVATYLAVIAMAFATGTAASLVTKLVQADKRQRQTA